MSTIYELIEMLRAELRNCTDRGGRAQIPAELGAALAEARNAAFPQAGSSPLADAHPS